MKFAPIAAALVLGSISAPALADGHGDHSDHADHAEAKAAKFTIDTPIEQLMADEKAKAVVVKHFGGQDVSQHPMYDQFKTMSLKAVAPFSQGMITDEMLEKIATDLAAIDGAAEADAEG